MLTLTTTGFTDTRYFNCTRFSPSRIVLVAVAHVGVLALLFNSQHLPASAPAPAIMVQWLTQSSKAPVETRVSPAIQATHTIEKTVRVAVPKHLPTAAAKTTKKKIAAPIEQQQRSKHGKENIGLLDSSTPEDMLSRGLRRAIDEDRSQLEFGQTFLATVASSAPFVGIFGTVYGIYQALIAIGLFGQSTLDKVAGPVGEALIMTGVGLAVAIPAAVAYNAFARANRNTLTRLNSFACDVFSFLATGIKSSPMLTDARATGEKMIELVRAQSIALPAQAPPSLSVR